MDNLGTTVIDIQNPNMNQQHHESSFKRQESHISVKVKEFLKRKLDECETQLSNVRKRRKIIKVVFVTGVILQVTVTSVMVCFLTLLPPVAVISLALSSSILMGLTARFNLEHKKAEATELITRLNKLQSKLDYVVSCNGDLTKDEYQDILKKFNC
jgi:curved DNA-binding protein CbpA